MNQKELLESIEKAAKKGVTGFSLGYNDLAGLPPEIGHLTNLTELDLANNQLSQLPPEPTPTVGTGSVRWENSCL